MTRVLNFGSLNIDYVYRLDHLVRPGETVHSLGLSLYCGGKGLNQSIALARAGAKVYHAGCVGEADGQILLDELSASGVNIDNVAKVSTRSGNAIIQVDGKGENSIILFGGANRRVTEAQIDSALSGFGGGDILLLQNEVNSIDLLIERASAKGMTIALNPSPCDGSVLSLPLGKVGVFLLNELEGREISGATDSAPEEIMAALRGKFPAAKIVLTLGERGAIYFDGRDELRQRAFKVQAVDTTAAGDAFTGYFLAGLAEGAPSRQIIVTAAKAAAIAVSKPGAAVSIPTKREVEEAALNESQVELLE